MSVDLGPGTPLIFVGPDEATNPSGLTIGAMYFVAEVAFNLFCEAPLIMLKGMPGNALWYCSCRFKPLNDGNTELVDAYDKVLEHA